MSVRACVRACKIIKVQILRVRELSVWTEISILFIRTSYKYSSRSWGPEVAWTCSIKFCHTFKVGGRGRWYTLGEASRCVVAESASYYMHKIWRWSRQFVLSYRVSTLRPVSSRYLTRNPLCNLSSNHPATVIVNWTQLRTICILRIDYKYEILYCPTDGSNMNGTDFFL